MPEESEKKPKHSPGASVSTDADALDPGPLSHESGREAFITQALKDFESPLIRYASTLLHDLDRARDVVQDTFIKLCHQSPSSVEDHLRAWLYRVCRNRALDVLRKESRTEPLEEIRWQKVAGPGLQPDEQADHRERLARLDVFLQRLTPTQREVIILKFQQDLSYQEISKITGLTTGNIGFLIHTGLKRLRDISPESLRD